MLSNEIVLNIIRNFIPHETLIFDDKDPPWISSRIKKIINDKNWAFKCFMKKKHLVNNSSSLERFSSLQNRLSSLIRTSKGEYFSKIAKTVFDPTISSEISANQCSLIKNASEFATNCGNFTDKSGSSNITF